MEITLALKIEKSNETSYAHYSHTENGIDDMRLR